MRSKFLAFFLSFSLLTLFHSLPTSALIIDGRDALKNEYSAVIDLEIFIGNENMSLCTATFISSNTLLTAAHCVYPYILAKEAKQTAEIMFPEGTSITQIFIPDLYWKYKEEEKKGYLGTDILRISSDIALIVLSKNQEIKPMQISTKPKIGNAIMIGYGGKNLLTKKQMDHTTDPSIGIKRIGKVEIEKINSNGRLVSKEEIYHQRAWYQWGDYFASLKPHRSLSSRGDSGGPLIQDGKIIGVISGVDAINQDDHTVYSSKTYFSGLNSSDFREIFEKAKMFFH